MVWIEWGLIAYLAAGVVTAVTLFAPGSPRRWRMALFDLVFWLPVVLVCVVGGLIDGLMDEREP